MISEVDKPRHFIKNNNDNAQQINTEPPIVIQKNNDKIKKDITVSF